MSIDSRGTRLTTQTRLWFELEDIYDPKFSGEDKEALIKRLTKDYNAFFNRLGIKYDKVWWHDSKEEWCFTTGEDGSYLTANMKMPGFWLNIHHLPIQAHTHMYSEENIHLL